MSDAVQTTEIPLRWIKDDQRFDASYYGQEGIEARVVIDELSDNGVSVSTVGELTEDLFRRSRFKRDYTNEENGEPYLTPTDMFMFPMKPRKYINNPPDGLKASPGWILITCSGTVGRTVIANEMISDCILTHDLIRAIPNEGMREYLYTYLNTWIGRAFTEQDEYGATVKHIEPHQVEEVPVPRFPEIEEEITEKINRSFRLREEAYQLLETAENRIYSDLNLPEFNKHTIEYYGGGDSESAKAFEISSEDLNLRLDASYHIPWVHFAIDEMKDSEKEGIGQMLHLEEITEIFVPPRFKRIYVEEPDEGIPMLHGSHVHQIDPQGMDYIWNQLDNLDRYVIEEDWILVTCSGTIGNLCLVSEEWDGWSATNHLLRLIPDSEQIHPGYLTAFLESRYGQVQFQRLTYGGVIDEIGESGDLVDDLIIFKPENEQIEQEIGSMVQKAYSNRDEANKLENEAVELLERELKSQTTE